MAQLKDTVVSGNIRITDTAFADTVQVTTIKAPSTSGGTTYGPGSTGQVLKSNGITTYWGNDGIRQSVTSTGNYRPLVFGSKDTTTISSLSETVTGELYTTSKLFFQPSTGNLHLYSASGDSPAFIFQRGSFTDGSLDWKIYDTEGALRFSQAGRNTSTETWVPVIQYKTSKNDTTQAIRSMLGVYGTAYGNEASNMLSGTEGLFQYGDGGPQIDFASAPGAAQAGSLIFTDNDDAATGASFHFVSTESDWNVTSKRFHAKSGISIGTNIPPTASTAPALRVTGSTVLDGRLTVGYASSTSVYPSGGITIQDIRDYTVTPNDGDKSVNFYFHMSGTPNTGKWWSILHMRGWTGGYSAWELAGPSHNEDQRTTPLYVRTSNVNSAWGSWRKIYDASNPPTASEVGALSTSTTYAGSSSVGGPANSANTLTLKELAFGSTLNTTNGLYAFTTTGSIYGTDTSDWVGMQIGSANDRFQIMGSVNGSPTGKGTMLIRANDVADSATGRDTGWSKWSGVMTADTIAAGTGISLSYGYWGGSADSDIKVSMTIGHSNSIGAQSVAVFKKFTYDECGHITGIADVTASDITGLGIIGTDEKMTQTNTTGSAAYRVLLSGNANDTTETTTGRKSSKLTFNPSTGALVVSGPTTATNFFGKLTQISGATPSGRITSANITGGTGAQYNDASMQLILSTSSMTTGKPAGDGYIMHYNWDNADICRAQLFVTDNYLQNDGVQYRAQGTTTGSWSNAKWTTLLSEKNAFTWSRLCDRFYITPTEPGFLRILTLGSEEENGRVMGSVKITISTDYNDYPPEVVCFEVMNVYKTAPAIHVLKSIQLGEKTSASHVITLVRLLKNSTGTEQYVEIYYNGASGKHINFSVRYEVFVPYDTFDRASIPISMPDNNTTLTVSPTTPTSDVILNDPTVIPAEVSYNMMRSGDYWGLATPVGTLNLPFATGLSGSDIEWVRTTRRGFLPHQTRSAGAGNVTDTSGGACYLGTSSWYFARAYIENTVGSLGSFQASTESDIPTSTGYQDGTMSYLQSASAYGGTDYRSGNSGSIWWAHYLTFKHLANYRYILRLPFWGGPQYQYTTNGTDQRWRTFITDENLDSTRLGTEATSVVMQSATPMPRIMAPLFQFHRANKFAFMPANKITIESSTDSGSTWQTYSVTDAVKRSLFISKTAGAAIMVGPKSSATRTASMRTRIIVECDGRDVIIDRLLFLISSNASSIAVDVKIALSSAPTTYIPIVTNGVASGTYAYEYLINLKHQSGSETIGGVSNVPKYYRFKTNNVLKFVFEFRYVSVSNTAYIGGILGYSGTYWDNDTTYTNKSYFAQHDHIYDWDADQTAIFPSAIKLNEYLTHSASDNWQMYNDGSGTLVLQRTNNGTPQREYHIDPLSGSNLATTVLYNGTTTEAETLANSTQFLYFIVTLHHNGLTNGDICVTIPASQSTTNVSFPVQWSDSVSPGYTKIVAGEVTYHYDTSRERYTFTATAASYAIQAGNGTATGVAVSGDALIKRVIGFGLYISSEFPVA